jgi:hypothetical protein
MAQSVLRQKTKKGAYAPEKFKGATLNVSIYVSNNKKWH